MKLSTARIVVTGASSVTGRDLLNMLAEHGADRAKIKALDSGRATGEALSFGEELSVDVGSSDEFKFDGVDLVLSASPARETAGLAKRATAAGAQFIDGSGICAFDPDVPVVVPEVNGELLEGKLTKNIVANPHSVAIFLALALNPLHKKAGVTRVVASTYQAVSHWGREAQDEFS